MDRRWIGMSDDGSSVTLRRFEGSFNLAPVPADSSNLRNGLVLDVEATGVDVSKDTVIEFAARPFQFDRTTGAVVSVGESFSTLNDPGEPLSPIVVRLTGLTDDKLSGKKLDDAGARRLIEDAHLVIAHNASYDRPMVERQLGAMHKVWGCTYAMIDWHELGFNTAKLEVLSLFHGFYFGAHRAAADVDGLLHLLTFDNPQTGAPYLADVLNASRRNVFRVDAVKSPFETKDLLKERKYRWDGGRKVWWREVLEAELDEEMAWLASEVYTRGSKATTQKITPFERFRPA
jgi:DNA polymerase III subunit epsilon